MMENPSFDEGILFKSRTVYKKSKPTIDKEKAKNIPDMQNLWKTIEEQEKLLDSLKSKQLPTPQDKKKIYYLTHQLISLKTQQYYIMDAYFPTLAAKKNKAEYYGSIADYQMNYPILPRGIMGSPNDTDFMFPRTAKDKKYETKIYSDEEIENMQRNKIPHFNFCNIEHLYQLIQHYEEIEDYIQKIPDSPLHGLLWTLDFYIEKANLTEQQHLIVECKKHRMPNRQIRQKLIDDLGLTHQENYISTIWNKAVKLISEAVILNYDEFLCRNYDKAWKKCCKCGKELLRDARCYVRKSKSADGLTTRCKQCDKKMRQKNK